MMSDNQSQSVIFLPKEEKQLNDVFQLSEENPDSQLYDKLLLLMLKKCLRRKLKNNPIIDI